VGMQKKSTRWKEQSGTACLHDTDGKAEFEFTPESKKDPYAWSEVSGTDARWGNRIVEEAYVWVASCMRADGPADGGNGNRKSYTDVRMLYEHTR